MGEITWTNTTKRLGELKPWTLNPRQSSKKQAARLLASWEEFGEVQTIAIGPDCEVYDGHQRLSALLAVHGAKYEIDVRQSSRPLTDAERRKLVAMLHAGAVGSWDWDLLSAWDAGALMAWGFDTATLADWKRDVGALDNLIESEKPDPPEDPGADIDRAEELRELWGVEPGQLWRVPSKTGEGEHRIICGDCTDAEVVARVMEGERAGAVVTDPPFNIGLDYDRYNDSRPEAEYLEMIRAAFGLSFDAVDDRGHLTCTLGHNQLWPVRAAIEDAGWTFRHIGVWHNPQRKAGSHPGMWPFSWEGVLDFTRRGFRKLANGNGVGQSDVWIETQGNDTDHPAERPIGLWTELIALVTAPSELVYEPFSGSGTTAVACERLGRLCRGVEISPAYVAVSLQRLADMGLEPYLSDEE